MVMVFEIFPSLSLSRFNREGDFLVTCGKDSLVNLWFSDNGERAGTFNGHNGAVWTTAVNCRLNLFFFSTACLHTLPDYYGAQKAWSF
jgi:translation initiation factor 3 subunit I